MAGNQTHLAGHRWLALLLVLGTWRSVIGGAVLARCMPGEGLSMEPDDEVTCQLCPEGTYSALNSRSGLRVCEPCRNCDYGKVVRKCTRTQDTACGPPETGPAAAPGESVWNQRTISERQAIVIVGSTAGALCGAMILIVAAICLRERCTQARKPKHACAEPGKGDQKALLGHVGPCSSLLLTEDTKLSKSPLDGVVFTKP